jgi:hypothetical protein
MGKLRLLITGLRAFQKLLNFLAAEFLLPIASTTSSWQFLGGPSAQNVTDEAERSKLATRARQGVSFRNLVSAETF